MFLKHLASWFVVTQTKLELTYMWGEKYLLTPGANEKKMNSGSIDFRVGKSTHSSSDSYTQKSFKSLSLSNWSSYKRPLYLCFLQNKPLCCKMNATDLHWRPQDFWGLTVTRVIAPGGSQVVLGFYSYRVFPIDS